MYMYIMMYVPALHNSCCGIYTWSPTCMYCTVISGPSRATYILYMHFTFAYCTLLWHLDHILYCGVGDPPHMHVLYCYPISRESKSKFLLQFYVKALWHFSFKADSLTLGSCNCHSHQRLLCAVGTRTCVKSTSKSIKRL